MDEGIQLNAVVKWFSAAKGFGFVAPEDGSPDAFLHISALNRAGLHDIAPGTTVLCRLVPGGRGRQVSDLVAVLGAAPQPAVPPPHAPSSPPQEVAGTVKWFKPDKGYGFVNADDGEDVFLHKSVLRRCSISHLGPGQRVLMHVQETAKGREASWVILLG